MTAMLGRRDFLGTAAAAGLVSGCKVAKGGKSSTARDPALDAKLQGFAEQIAAEYPENATILGVDKGKLAPLRHHLTDRTAAGRAKLAEGARARLAELRKLDLSNLDAPSVLDANVALTAHEITDQGYRFPYGDVINLDQNIGFRNMPYTVTQIGGAFIEIPDFLSSRHTVETQDDAEAFIDRVGEYAKALDGETGRLAHERSIGVVAPDFLLDSSLNIVGGGASQKPEDTAIYKAMSGAVSKHSLDQRLTSRVHDLVTTAVLPALGRQVEELKQHRAAAKHDAGVWKLPDGEAYYGWALKAGTTTDRSPAEVHQLGLEQNQLINDRMDAILTKQGITGGTVGQRMVALSKDPKQLFPNTDAGRQQLLAFLNGRVADMRNRLPRAFATLVPGNLIIKRVPPEIEAGAPGGYALAGSIDGKVPGQYYINLQDTANWPRFSLPTLTYHEGIPGHVWQGEYAYKLPLIRSLMAFNAYQEGWALYAEQLGDELGAYDGDPLGQLGYLQSIGFRCCRLVVDTGLHAMRWSREAALQWFYTQNGSPIDGLRREVDRYCAMPGQACGYQIGHLEIDGLRKKAQQALKSRYDLRTFDDAVVKGGNVPLTLLGKVIDNYIAANG